MSKEKSKYKSNRRAGRLDLLEARLTGPKRVALFGHRNVGKTTLLAMFYREASSGRVQGLRMAAAEPRTAEYPRPRRSPRSSRASRWPAPWPKPSSPCGSITGQPDSS